MWTWLKSFFIKKPLSKEAQRLADYLQKHPDEFIINPRTGHIRANTENPEVAKKYHAAALKFYKDLDAAKHKM